MTADIRSPTFMTIECQRTVYIIKYFVVFLFRLHKYQSPKIMLFLLQNYHQNYRKVFKTFIHKL